MLLTAVSRRSTVIVTSNAAFAAGWSMQGKARRASLSWNWVTAMIAGPAADAYPLW
jgi:hypothetical protein